VHYTETGEPAWDVIDGDVEVHDHDIVDAGEYRGHGGFRRWLEDWGAAWSDFSMEPEEFLDCGERVVMVVRMRATGLDSGIALERQDAIVWELRDEKVVRVDYYNSRDQAAKAVGLRE
jgi:ketosteroid isomerase-like protein